MSDKKQFPVHVEKESFLKNMSKRRYQSYMMRELTGIFFVIYAALYVLQFQALAAGKSSYQAFVTTMMSPPIIILSLVILVFSVYHTVTWLYLNAWLARNRWSDQNASQRQNIFLATVALWIVASVIIAFLIFLR